MKHDLRWTHILHQSTRHGLLVLMWQVAWIICGVCCRVEQNRLTTARRESTMLAISLWTLCIRLWSEVLSEKRHYASQSRCEHDFVTWPRWCLQFSDVATTVGGIAEEARKRFHIRVTEGATACTWNGHSPAS